MAECEAGVRPIRVLLVEDDPDTRLLLAEALADDGYQVEGAASAEEALQVLQRCPPGIIFCDIDLPGMDGYQFLEQARRTAAGAEVPAYALSGLAGEADVRRAHEAGYDGHLAKPVDVDVLSSLIRDRCRAPG